MKNWKEEHLSSQPDALQQIAQGLYIERRNIREVTHEAADDMEAYTDWVCESRIISVDEYHMLQAIKEIDTQKAIDDYTEQLIEEGLL